MPKRTMPKPWKVSKLQEISGQAMIELLNLCKKWPENLAKINLHRTINSEMLLVLKKSVFLQKILVLL